MCCAGEVNINLTEQKLKPTCVRTVLCFAEIVFGDFMFFEIFHNRNIFQIYMFRMFLYLKKERRNACIIIVRSRRIKTNR